MKWVFSSIGLKIIMALSGIVMVTFLAAHLAGNLLFFAGPDAINNYALKLREISPILWFLRIGLIVAVIAHVSTAITLTNRNKAARPANYLRSNTRESTFASRNMMITGLIILSFILYHLAHFTFRWTHKQAFADIGEFDVYSMMVLSFQSPFVSLFYIFSILLLMIHLHHGVSSFFQTLGINGRSINRAIKLSSISISTLLALGFLTLPLSVILGVVR